MITTQAWVLHQGGQGNGRCGSTATLCCESYSFPETGEYEVLVEPIYGCWEGNMSHALKRSPVDICRQRQEERVVIGNAGVVRVLKLGGSVSLVKKDDLCMVFCNGAWDDLGYPKKIFAYDAPGTVGLLAKQTKLHERQLIRIPPGTRHSLQQWAAFSLRYITAWANWKLAYGCWRLQCNGDHPTPHVWGWGGGVTLAELTLAKFSHCRVAMMASNDHRLVSLAALSIEPIDRRQFPCLAFDPERYRADPDFRKSYQESEQAFLETVRQKTEGRGVSIFIDFIGLPVFRATLKSLSRPGVVTTAGWKEGMNLSMVRAMECMNWHMHVHTHYARYQEALEAVQFAQETDWSPPVSSFVYSWESIPQLAQECVEGKTDSYFPLFQINKP